MTTLAAGRAVSTPGIVRFATWLTFLNTGVMFEELIVDRNGLWESMQYYQGGNLWEEEFGAVGVWGFRMLGWGGCAWGVVGHVMSAMRALRIVSSAALRLFRKFAPVASAWLVG